MSAAQPKARKRSVPVSVKIGSVSIGVTAPLAFLAGTSLAPLAAEDPRAMAPVEARSAATSADPRERARGLSEVYRVCREGIRTLRVARDTFNGDTNRDALFFLSRLSEEASK